MWRRHPAPPHEPSSPNPLRVPSHSNSYETKYTTRMYFVCMYLCSKRSIYFLCVGCLSAAGVCQVCEQAFRPGSYAAGVGERLRALQHREGTQGTVGLTMHDAKTADSGGGGWQVLAIGVGREEGPAQIVRRGRVKAWCYSFPPDSS